MREILIVCLLIIQIQASAQSEFFIKGHIIDAATELPLPYANIFYAKKHLGTSADANGHFQLYLPAADITDTISISYVGYEELKISIENCLSKDVFGLQTLLLDDVVVSAKVEKFDVESFMQRVVQEYNLKKNKETHIAYARYAETAVQDNEYIMYMESLGYTVITPVQMNAAPLTNTNFICENTKCFVTDPKWKIYAVNLNKDSRGNVPPSQDIILRAYRLLELSILSINRINKYRFKLDSIYSINGQFICAIQFRGKGEAGTIFVSYANYQIITIRYETNDYWSRPYHKNLKADVELNFVYLEGIPYFSSGFSVYEKDDLLHLNQYEMIVQKTKEVKIDKDLYWQLSSNPYILYDPTQWSHFESKWVHPIYGNWELPELNKSEFEDEFVSASGKWFPSWLREIGGDNRTPDNWLSLIVLFK